MINILMVDDNSDKLSKIIRVIKEMPESDSLKIEIAVDIVTAEKFMTSESFDLMILDLQLPTRLGQEPRADAGVHFLQDLNRRSDLKRPFHIIGITAHEGLFEEYSDIFENELWALIRFEEQYNNWEEKLRNKIKYLIVSKKEILNPSNLSYEYTLAVVTALKSELDSILELPASWEIEQQINDKSTIYYKGFFVKDAKRISVIAAYCPQMGMTASSVLTMKIIQNYRPKYLCMTGIAAGIRGKGNYGDILLADHSWDYGSGKMVYDEDKKETHFMPDPKPITLEPEIKTLFEQFDSTILYEMFQKWKWNKPSVPPKIIIGPVASGAAVLENSSLVDGQIKQQNRKLIGIEMEIYGVYYAAKYCSEPRPTVFALKSICDFADNEKSDDFQDYAAYTSAQTLYHFALNSL
ncbi:phosphorylase family protein [Paenibacillus medicaginis]|uniref:Response regulatory domain-containing protein n=1 Tax=Paenibacillus medicaginis TaxID=1470560 RepID=A0ABV5C9C0_9BACL